MHHVSRCFFFVFFFFCVFQEINVPQVACKKTNKKKHVTKIAAADSGSPCEVNAGGCEMMFTAQSHTFCHRESPALCEASHAGGTAASLFPFHPSVTSQSQQDVKKNVDLFWSNVWAESQSFTLSFFYVDIHIYSIRAVSQFNILSAITELTRD